MSKYQGAKYLGEDPIHLFDGSLILKNEITELLSEEAAINDNNFKPVYADKEAKKVEKKVIKKYKKKGAKK